MSKVDTAGPHPVGDEPSQEKGPSPVIVGGGMVDEDPGLVDMEAYRDQVPLWKRVWQHSLTQMLLLSVQAFCGPAMDDAISGEWLALRSFLRLMSKKVGSFVDFADVLLQGWVVVVWQHRRRPTLRMFNSGFYILFIFRVPRKFCACVK